MYLIIKYSVKKVIFSEISFKSFFYSFEAKHRFSFYVALFITEAADARSRLLQMIELCDRKKFQNHIDDHRNRSN